MTTYLLDATVLIALTIAEHEHHARASAWAATIRGVATCPVVEGALVRYLVRIGEGAVAAVDVLRELRRVPGHAFWPDSVSYADVDLLHVRGHRQVTDAYLLSLVASHPDARLATLDVGLAQLAPSVALLLPVLDGE